MALAIYFNVNSLTAYFPVNSLITKLVSIEEGLSLLFPTP